MSDKGPRLRTVNKAKAPFDLNKFPKKFVNKLGEELAYLIATRENESLTGDDWEEIFSNCIGAEWKPSNVGLDDVQLDNCCWGAKTVISSRKNVIEQTSVRLISGRNSLAYSYGKSEVLNIDPDEAGQKVLEIWNERVSAVRNIFKFVRTVVLVKGKKFDEFMIFEFDTKRYDPELYYFKWNNKNNLEGYEKASHVHSFTWQPHGSQFTIIEDIPKERLVFKIKKPEKISKETVLKSINYGDDWITIL